MSEERPSVPARRIGGRIEYYAMGMFDLLGTSDRLKALAEIPLQDTNQTHYSELFSNEILRVHKFRRVFSEFFIGASQQRQLPSNLSVEQMELFNWGNSCAVEFMVFSDMIVTHCPVSKNDHLSVTALRSMICAAGTALLLLLNEGVPFRGGIEIAPAVKLWDHGIFGPALASGHTLEQQACWPRVLVGKNALDFLHNCEQDNGSDFFARFNRTLATTCLSYIGTDRDNTNFVDYLSKAFLSEVGNVLDIIPQALRFIRREKSRLIADGDKNLADRYENLEQYFMSRGFTSSG